MAFELPPLPYSQDALDPYISAKTLSFHHGDSSMRMCPTALNQTKGRTVILGSSGP